jgi:phosphohistidine phosphatase SixA
MPRIMIIRHGEKHNGGRERGVNIEGFHTKHELTVRGWQRAGALVRFFAPVGGLPPGSPISTPRSIFASAATPESPSLRAQHTVKPLAETLGLQIDNRHAEGEESAVAAAALAAAPLGPVLISWHHSHIPALARSVAGGELACPEAWPDERFDVVWILDRSDEAAAPGAPWRFSQVAQRLFAYDRPEPI